LFNRVSLLLGILFVRDTPVDRDVDSFFLAELRTFVLGFAFRSLEGVEPSDRETFGAVGVARGAAVNEWLRLVR
jgi:hypothetical protein